jgi:hypothetical protein
LPCRIPLRGGQQGSELALAKQHQAQHGQQQHDTTHMLCLKAEGFAVRHVMNLVGLIRLSAEFLEEPYVKSLLKKW